MTTSFSHQIFRTVSYVIVVAKSHQQPGIRHMEDGMFGQAAMQSTVFTFPTLVMLGDKSVVSSIQCVSEFKWKCVFLGGNDIYEFMH